MSVYVWSDVSPDGGCTLVRFSMRATSLREVVTAIRGVPELQNTTEGHLLKRGGARRARADESESALAHPDGVVWWENDKEKWRVLL